MEKCQGFATPFSRSRSIFRQGEPGLVEIVKQTGI